MSSSEYLHLADGDCDICDGELGLDAREGAVDCMFVFTSDSLPSCAIFNFFVWGCNIPPRENISFCGSDGSVWCRNPVG